MVFCICCGDAVVSRPRYKNVNSLIVIPLVCFTSTVLTVEEIVAGHLFLGPHGPPRLTNASACFAS